MVRLIDPSGVEVRVGEAQAAKLLALGYAKAGGGKPKGAAGKPKGASGGASEAKE